MQPTIELNALSKSLLVRRPRAGGAAARLRDFVSPRTECVLAIDRLSFSISPGERVAFIGPNGAGKSTTLKVLAGILQPDAGDVRVFVPRPVHRAASGIHRVSARYEWCTHRR